MSLDVGEALRDGFGRTTARNGLVLMLAIFVVSLSTTVFSQTVTVALVDALAELASEQGTQPPQEGDLGPTPFALPLSPWIAGISLVVSWVLGQVVTIVAIRTFVSDVTDTIPGAFLRRRIGWVLVNVIVGQIVVGVLVLVGLVLLILPGIFLAVSLYFVTQVIAVEDEDFVEAMRESWRLARGSRIQIFLLAVVLVGLSFLVSIPSLLVAETLPVGAVLYSLVATAPVSVFAIATVARAYVQLETTREETETIGALGPDELGDL